MGDFALGGTPWSGSSSVVYLVMGRTEFHAGFDLKSKPGVVKIASQHQSFGADVYRAGDLDGDGLKTPLYDSPQAVDLKVLLPDARTAILPLGFTFTDKVRRLSIGDLAGLVTFEAPDPLDTNRIHPRVLGDVNGDRIDDYALRTFDLGSAYLIYGGTKWKDVVTSQELEEKAVRFHYRDGSRTTPELFPLGDLNGDDKADYAICKAVIPDAIRVLGALFLGAAPLDCEKSGDADDDGALNITDAIYLLRFLFLGGPAPPAPYPEPGPDPTPDSLRCLPHGA